MKNVCKAVVWDIVFRKIIILNQISTKKRNGLNTQSNNLEQEQQTITERSN